MKKRIWIIIATAALIITVGIGATLAYIVSSSRTLENTFTVGKVNITLTETTGKEYKILPGATLHKDPTVKVLADSDDCWVLVKVEKSSDFDEFCTYEIAEGWTEMDGADGVYYRQAKKSSADTDFNVLNGDLIKVKDTVTEEQLNTLNTYPTLSFTAYAVQRDGVPTAAAAWEIIGQ